MLVRQLQGKVWVICFKLIADAGNNTGRYGLYINAILLQRKFIGVGYGVFQFD
jgi:hypothetical protein